MNAKKALQLPKSIWAIGLMTLLMNLSTVIVFSLSPLYLTKVLGVSALGIGFLEGIVDFISWLTRVFSGMISDALRKRKPLLLIAISLTCLARPLFAMASTVYGIFVSRGIDRIANGLQAPPRDALIGDSAPRNSQGSAFGLRQSLGMLGSALGAIATFYWLKNNVDNNYQQIFWFASIPPFLALLFVIVMVKDSFHNSSPKTVQNGQVKNSSLTKKEDKEPYSKAFLHLHHVKSLGREYWRTLIVAFIFCLSTFSGAFMILRGEEVTHVSTIGPAVMISQNIFAMLIAYPLGRLFDRFDHRKLLAIGFLTVICANLVFYSAQSFTIIILGSALWGLQMGINQSLLTATISSCTSESNRGTGFGIYYITAGSGILISNTILGRLADLYGLQNAFFFSLVMAFLAILCLPLLRSRNETETKNNKQIQKEYT